jgi:predicted nucleotidyltransferase
MANSKLSRKLLYRAAGQRDDEGANREIDEIDIDDQTTPLRRVSSMTHADPDEVARTAAVDFACRLVPYWQAALGTELLGVYLIGSIAHGGFSRRYSDVDMALITETGLSSQVLDRVQNEAAALSAEWGPKLSVFWADRHFSLGRFFPLDRIDYLDHAVVLMERECVRPARPMLQEIQRYLCGVPFANWTENARRFAASEALKPNDRKAYLKTLLYPGRFCYSWATGRIGSNDDAVAFLGEGLPTRLDISLINRALQCRRAAGDPDSLFADRATLLSQVNACAALIANPQAT